MYEYLLLLLLNNILQTHPGQKGNRSKERVLESQNRVKINTFCKKYDLTLTSKNQIEILAEKFWVVTF